MRQATAAELRKNTAGIIRAPRRMPVAEAVHKYMRVPVGVGNSVEWDPNLAPYVVEPMNCLASREYDAVIFVGPARTGKTIGLIDGWVVYNVVCDPSDMLIIQMTEEKAREHSKKRLARTFRVSPEVACRLSPSRNDNNVHDRTFLAGNYLKIGWPSINIMSSSDFKCVALTDYDRFPEDIDGEGDGFSLASKRTTTFMSAGMTLVESSPGREITNTKWRRKSPHEAPPTTGILSLYNRGDRRRWYWPCPHCGEYFQPAMEAMTGFGSLKAECITDISCSAEQARTKLLNALAAGTTPSAGPGAVHIHAGNGNIVGDSIRAAVMNRAGYAQAEKDNAYNGYTLRELARASLVDRGIGISGVGTAQAMVGLAFTHSSSDFGNILMDVAHKAALLGWDEASETFEQWTRKGTLTDFKTAHRVGLESLASLRKVRAGAEYKYVTIKDRGEPIALATYGELFSIDRQTIINDDLDMLTRIPQAMGLAARATVGDLVWAVLTSNPKMSDGKPLFHADHGNLVAADLSIEGLDTARKAMLLQKSGDRRLNIRPAYMLTPVAIESRANQLIKSASVPGADANSGIVNPIQNFVTVASEARLDDSSQTDYYLTAAQGRDTIEVAYLDGIDTPYLEQQQGFTVDGAAFKVRIDAGVAPLDWRGLVKVTKK